MHALMLATLLAAIDLPTAQRAYAEMDAMCAADGGKLWGRSLCGPMTFANAQTREAVRRMHDDLEETKVPDSIGIANTSVDWDGTRWTMVLWPLPQSTVSRRVLLAHESFHRIQQDLGLPNASPRNAHLDSAEARAWMRLEWRALARALATGDERAVADALAFRAQRRAAGGGEEERQLEINEGLAEHTGFALAVPHLRERIAPLVRKLANAEKSETFARSFAYTSGPAWGALLEMKDARWTRKLKPTDDLGDLARKAWGLRATPPRDDYQAAAVHEEERVRAEKKRELLAQLRAKFVDGPVLIIPLKSMSFTFDPNSVQPLGDLGSIYQSMEVRDVWGKIVVTGGGLISADFQRIVVPANGDGYTLTLNDGWKVIAGPREGDKTVVQ
jgi:hypothetical protein